MTFWQLEKELGVEAEVMFDHRTLSNQVFPIQYMYAGENTF